jgi:hypothetical protein
MVGIGQSVPPDLAFSIGDLAGGAEHGRGIVYRVVAVADPVAGIGRHLGGQYRPQLRLVIGPVALRERHASHQISLFLPSAGQHDQQCFALVDERKSVEIERDGSVSGRVARIDE